MILERLQYGFGELYWRTKPRGVIWFHILTSRGQWYVNCGGHDLYDDLRLKRCLRMESEHPKPVIWYLSCLFSLISYFDLQRSFISGGHDLQDHLRSKRDLRIDSEHQKLVIWYLPWPIFIDFIFLPSKVIDIWGQDL